ncbi:hypothetical protein ACOMHN_011276 [Nucella lapillus]
MSQSKVLYTLSDDPKRKEFLDELFEFMVDNATPILRVPIMGRQPLDLYVLYREVLKRGGLLSVIQSKLWREIRDALRLPTTITSAAYTLRVQYWRHLYAYECHKHKLSKPQEVEDAIERNQRDAVAPAAGLDNLNGPDPGMMMPPTHHHNPLLPWYPSMHLDHPSRYIHPAFLGHNAWFGFLRFGSFGSARLGSGPFGSGHSAWFGSGRVSSGRVGSARFVSARVGYFPPYGSFPGFTPQPFGGGGGGGGGGGMGSMPYGFGMMPPLGPLPSMPNAFPGRRGLESGAGPSTSRNSGSFEASSSDDTATTLDRAGSRPARDHNGVSGVRVTNADSSELARDTQRPTNDDDDGDDGASSSGEFRADRDNNTAAAERDDFNFNLARASQRENTASARNTTARAVCHNDNDNDNHSTVERGAARGEAAVERDVATDGGGTAASAADADADSGARPSSADVLDMSLRKRAAANRTSTSDSVPSTSGISSNNDAEDERDGSTAREESRKRPRAEEEEEEEEDVADGDSPPVQANATRRTVFSFDLMGWETGTEDGTLVLRLQINGVRYRGLVNLEPEDDGDAPRVN